MDTSSTEFFDPSMLDVLDRYLAGDASPTEREMLEAQMANHPAIRARLRDPFAYAAVPSTLVDSVEKLGLPRPKAEKAWEQLRARIEAGQGPGYSRTTRTRDTNDTKKSRPVQQWWYNTAIGVAVAAGLTAVIFLPEKAKVQPHAAQTARVFATEPGQHATVTLADGSEAVLGPATRLDVVTDRHGATTVQLVGQAKFTVTHQSNAPFLVRTGQSLTQVLGTTFLVRHYADDQDARIVVIDGRVMVQGLRDSTDSKPKAVLDAQMLGVVTDSGRVLVTPGIVVQNYLGWTHGELNFVETPVRDIVADLARAYDVELQVLDSALAKRKFTWVVPTRSYPLAEALDELTTMLGAHVQVAGRRMTLVPGRKTSQRAVPHNSPFSQESRYGK